MKVVEMAAHEFIVQYIMLAARKMGEICVLYIVSIGLAQNSHIAHNHATLW